MPYADKAEKAVFAKAWYLRNRLRIAKRMKRLRRRVKLTSPCKTCHLRRGDASTVICRNRLKQCGPGKMQSCFKYKDLRSSPELMEWIALYRRRRDASNVANGLCVRCSTKKKHVKARAGRTTCAPCHSRQYKLLLLQLKKLRSTTSGKAFHDNARLKYRRALRAEVLRAYGEKCACCGERNHIFLTIDHIRNDGAKHRKTITTSFYLWLKQSGWPPGFQTLCYNCNCGKYKNGGVCPHVKISDSTRLGTRNPLSSGPRR